MNKKDCLIILTNTILRARQFNNRCIKEFATKIKNKKILELGSGKKYKNKYYYSAKQFFHDSNKFIQSDITKEYGHKIIDATKMKYKNKYDIILCMNVLEHIYDYNKAIENIHNALKPNGTAIISVPVFYPFHDEPHDYWRFTEHSLKIILKKFTKIKIKHSGLKQCPFAYYIEAKK